LGEGGERAILAQVIAMPILGHVGAGAIKSAKRPFYFYESSALPLSYSGETNLLQRVGTIDGFRAIGSATRSCHRMLSGMATEALAETTAAGKTSMHRVAQTSIAWNRAAGITLW
jgi:hypothetical protein